MAKTPPFSVCYEYCVGGGGENPGANAVQSDYNQNDVTAKDYIKNRPCYESSLCICDHNEKNDYGKINPAVQMNEGITLVKGEHLLFEIIEDGKVKYDEIERLGIDGGDGFFYFKSGRFYSWEEGSNVITVQTWYEAYEISVKITRPGEVKQLDDKFLPDNVKQTLLPIKLGENTVEYNGDMNCCSIYADKPYAKGDVIIIKGTLNGVTETCEITMPEVVENGFTDISKYIGVLCGYVSMPGSNHLFFNDGTTGTKIKVYRLETHPNGTVIQHLNEEVENLNETFTEAITELNKKTEHLIEKIGEATVVEGDLENYASIVHTKDFITGDVLVIKATLEGVTEEHELTMIDANESGMTYFENISPWIGSLNMPSRNYLFFMNGIEGTKIEVYKNTVQSNSNIITEIDAALDRIIEKYGLGDDSGDGGFVMPDGAFPVELDMSVSAGIYKFVVFITDEGEIYEEIPEYHTVNGGVGTTIDDATSAELSRDYPTITMVRDGKLFGYTTLTNNKTHEYKDGTTYLLRVGDA